MRQWCGNLNTPARDSSGVNCYTPTHDSGVVTFYIPARDSDVVTYYTPACEDVWEPIILVYVTVL